MKEEKILFKKTNVIIISLIVLVCTLIGTIPQVNHMCFVYAQTQNVQYEYDSSGRLIHVLYPDGTEIKYQYDKNGNIVSSEKKPDQKLPDENEPSGGSQMGGSQTGDEQIEGNQGETGGNTQQDENQTGGNQIEGNQTDGNQTGDRETGILKDDNLHYSAEDIKNYNQFKKRKPIIKSLKSNTKKKKHYLVIRIKQIKKYGVYGEDGYQIKYASNKKLKKAKTLKIARKKKGSITNKQWKVKKGKTYYVKVRAYMKTKTGKTIYSKYSKVKKITVKK